MNPVQGQPETADEQTLLRQQLRDVGMVLVQCDESGELMYRPKRGEDWLADLLCGSPMVSRALQSAAAEWAEQSNPQGGVTVPGVYFAPAPLTARRRRCGYIVGLIPMSSLLKAEHLASMCQSAKLDETVTRSLLTQLPPAHDSDGARLATLVRMLHEDHAQLMADQQAIESTGQQLAESYEEISLLYTIIQSMTVVEQPERLVTIACEELLNTIPYAWVGALFTEDHERLKKLAGRIIIAGKTRASASKLRLLASSLLNQAEPETPVVLEPGTNPNHALYSGFGRTVVIHPVASDGRVIGLLIAGEKQGSDPSVSNVDIKLIGAVATHMGIFLENAALYDDLNAMFLGTLEALTASIDAKDRYTCGHSQRVALLTQQLAREVGLGDQIVKRMHIAGLVHDVGKIGVPERVLLKPGKLTDEEFGWIRKHPEMGYRILRDIPQLKDLLPGVLYHHERWDGRGYPKGLRGEDIPYVARLIGLADSFDAMSSTRTYRSAMAREQVLEEIIRCAGSQFDPELAPIFVRLDFSEYDRLVIEHKANQDSTISANGYRQELRA